MRYICLGLLVLIVVQGCRSERATVTPADLYIKDVTVVSFDATPNAAIRDVLIRDGKIVFVGDVADESAVNAVEIIDGTNRFLIPGLIDSHTHLNEIPGMTLQHEESFPGIAAEARRQIPRSYLYQGFTTVIDLNSEPAAIKRWNSQALRPQAYFCGASPVFDGYPMSFMPKPARYEIMPYFLYDEPRARDFPDTADPRLHTPQAVVTRIHADGGICVKTHYERGFGGRGDLPVPTTAQIRELVAAAHDKGMPVLLHANSEAAQSFGVAAGVDAFAHGMWTWNDRSLTTLHEDIRTLVAAAIDQGIALQPTIQVLHGEQDLHNPHFFDDPRLEHVLPNSLIEWYQSPPGQWWAQRMLGIPVVAQLVSEGRWDELDEPPLARVSAVLELHANSGGRLLFGSDTPSDPTYANPPGLNGRIEMDRWIDAGVSPAQLFHAATLGNAKFFGLETTIGTVEIGKRADLLLLKENPLHGVAAYDSIDYVILSGKPVARSSLSALADAH
ncbi:MAG: amidohydrolase family protein [Pseudomonadota bacterium]